MWDRTNITQLSTPKKKKGILTLQSTTHIVTFTRRTEISINWARIISYCVSYVHPNEQQLFTWTPLKEWSFYWRSNVLSVSLAINFDVSLERNFILRSSHIDHTLRKFRVDPRAVKLVFVPERVWLYEYSSLPCQYHSTNAPQPFDIIHHVHLVYKRSYVPTYTQYIWSSICTNIYTIHIIVHMYQHIHNTYNRPYVPTYIQYICINIYTQHINTTDIKNQIHEQIFS
jgi:hypothetical protein